MTRRSERESFADRYLAMQPSLDRSIWRLWGQLPGVEGEITETALARRADSLPHAISASTPGQRNADAPAALSQDSLDGGPSNGEVAMSTPLVSIFVDGEQATTRGETGAEIAAGPRVGPATLERLLCEGRVQVIQLQDARPVRATSASRAIPSATRRFVLWRDSGCVIDACTSRYRLQPHHVQPWSQGGSHLAENIATLCWYHHHVAIHGSGFRLDPESPALRRRLVPPEYGPDPPH